MSYKGCKPRASYSSPNVIAKMPNELGNVGGRKTNTLPLIALILTQCSCSIHSVCPEAEMRQARWLGAPPPPPLLNCYFQVAFQIQLPKLFDLSFLSPYPEENLCLLSWALGAHVENLARLPVLAKFSHTKRPVRGSGERMKETAGGTSKGASAPPPRAL